MASGAIVSLLLTVFSTVPFVIDVAGTRVSISTPISPVTVGGILAIKCQVWDTQHNFVVSILRSSNGRTKQLTNGPVIQSTGKLSLFLATRTFSDGSVVYFLTMTEVTKEDQGEYVCRVIDISESNKIAEDKIDLELYSLPGNMYPVCDSIPNLQSPINIGETLTLQCTSGKGVPAVQMKWINTKSTGYLSSYETMDGNLLHSEVITHVDRSLNGAVFLCEIRTDALSDWKRTCVVGPVKIRSHISSSNVLNSQTLLDDDLKLTYEKPSFSETCGECSSNVTVEFYLTVATAGAGLLTILFIVTTIIMCHKYHSISEQTRRQPTRVLTSQQSVEPVYVSLQRRPQSTYSEREYMTLEDPNNPDNKIILPKETFDDYCRTMTLKRV